MFKSCHRHQISHYFRTLNMTYKDIVFELFHSAIILLNQNKIYASNLSLCACYELLKTSAGLAKQEKISEIEAKLFASQTPNHLIKLRNEMEKMNDGKNISLEFADEFNNIIFRHLAKSTVDDIKFKPSDTDRNWDNYNRTKHGPNCDKKGKFNLNSTFVNELTKKDVEKLMQYIGYILLKLYPKDVDKMLQNK